MLTLTSIQLNAWLAAFLWPLSRILGLIAAAPVYGNASVPVPVKVLLGVLICLAIAPAVPAGPALDPTSYAGLLILVQQLLIGLAMGFAMRIVFAAVEFAGEVASLTMGLGFATFFDPQTQGRSSGISQFLALVVTMVFLAADAHLALIEALAESFVRMPVAPAPWSAGAPLELARWGAAIFASGFQLALPIVAALLITNIALGILTRAAPQLNLFGIGFPISLGVGLLVLSLALPYLSGPVQALFHQGLDTSRRLAQPAPGPR